MDWATKNNILFYLFCIYKYFITSINYPQNKISNHALKIFF